MTVGRESRYRRIAVEDRTQRVFQGTEPGFVVPPVVYTFAKNRLVVRKNSVSARWRPEILMV